MNGVQDCIFLFFYYYNGTQEKLEFRVGFCIPSSTWPPKNFDLFLTVWLDAYYVT